MILSKQGWIEEHSHHMQQITTNKPSVITIGVSIVYGFSRCQHVWKNYFGKEALNCGIRGDKAENIQDKSINDFAPYQYSSYNLWDKQLD